MKNLTILTGTLAVTMTISSIALSAKTNSYKKIILFQEGNKMQDDDYKVYRAEQEKKIAENDKKIAELKSKRDKVKKENVARYDSKIDELQVKNNDLKKRIMENYKDQGKEKWESFKKEFNHDMGEVQKSLKDLFKDNS